jgi:uncharacterized membrane protein YphA (DoxX/SURF4 family)
MRHALILGVVGFVLSLAGAIAAITIVDHRQGHVPVHEHGQNGRRSIRTGPGEHESHGGNSGKLPRRKPNMNIALWIVQALLAALFLFTGGMKLIMPIEEMLKQMPLPLPGWFLRFIGVAELLGGLGLVLPWLLRIRPRLTSLAAAGLVIIMIGATVFTLMSGEIAMALMPLVVGILCAFVTYGRWRPAP